MLTSQARETLRSRRDADPRRGARGRRHEARRAPGDLASSGWRRLRETPIQRIGLSATQRPIEEIGRFVSGGRPIAIVDAGTRKELDLEVVVPVEDMRELGSTRRSRIRCRPTGRRWTSAPSAARNSIWPSIYPEILRLVEEHRSTIVFVNNRRLAERLALRLNELARASARSPARTTARSRASSALLVEEDLKAGRIPCLVATSSLELGIDMGAVDLVIQVESPKSVARGLQRIGRAGPRARRRLEGAHLPEVPRRPARERGRRARDARRRDRGDEDPAQPARRARAADRRDHRRRGDRASTTCTRSSRARIRSATSRARSSRTCSTCSPAAIRRTSSPSCARASSGIAPAASIRARDGARRLAVTNAGHDSRPRAVRRVPRRRRRPRRRARRGDGLRGARRPDVPARRLDVADRGDHARPGARLAGARACPARCRSGRARASAGRTSSARRSAPRRASCSALTDAKALERLRGDYHLDERAARNLLTFLREQQDATGAVPSDRTIVVERFRDEIGDWRVCILSPFGGRVHAPWAMAIAARLREAHGIEAQSIWSDDGIALHFPEADAPPPIEELLDRPGRGRGSRRRGGGRHRALRRALPRERRPRAADPAPPARRAHAALAAAAEGAVAAAGRAQVRQLPGHPRDLPRVPAGRLRPACAARAAAGAEDARARPRRGRDAERVAVLAPRCSSTTSRPTCTRTTRRRPSGGRRRCRSTATCCASCSARRSCATCSTRDAVDEVERQLRGDADDARPAARPAAAPRRPARRRVRRRARRAAARRAPRGARAHRRRGAPDRGRGRRPLPRRARRDAAVRACPTRSSRAGPSRCASSCCATRRVAGRSRPAGERRASAATSASCSPSSSATSSSCAASCAPAAPSASGATPTCCAACGVRRSPRCGARSSRSSRRRSRASCPAGTASTGARRCARRSCRCRRCRLPVALWESEVLPRRVPGYRPEHLDALTASGEVVWVGAGPDRVGALLPRGRGRARPGAGTPRARRATSTTRSAPRSSAARSSGSTCSRRRGSRRRSRCRRSGISSGRAR